jgi:hypothetical protein
VEKELVGMGEEECIAHVVRRGSGCLTRGLGGHGKQCSIHGICGQHGMLASLFKDNA